jgi:hypothetical protein
LIKKAKIIEIAGKLFSWVVDENQVQQIVARVIPKIIEVVGRRQVSETPGA